jgi:hypothetical protein
LTTAASSQLDEVSRLIAGIQLRDGPDARSIDSPSSPPFSSQAAYRILAPVHATDASACTAWGSRLPAKVKIFTYLADIDRLSSRANLFFKNCAPSDRCVACGAVETGRHIFFDCPAATAVWARIGTPVPDGAFSIWDLRAPSSFPAHIWHVGVAAILWTLWKARNDHVFNGVTCTRQAIFSRACADLAIWRWRLHPDDRPLLDLLRSFLISPM